MNLASLISEHPERSRALFDGRDWTSWGDLRSRVVRFSLALRDAGVEEDDRVAIALPTSVDFVVAYLATLGIGAIAVPLNPNAPPAELQAELDTTEPRLLVAGGRALERAGELDLASAPAKTANTTKTPNDEAPPKTVLVEAPLTKANGFSQSNQSSDSDQSDQSNESSQSKQFERFEQFEPVPRKEGDTAVLLFTSGTAGLPKAAMLTHGNLVSNIRQMLAVPGEMVRADDVALTAVPLFHVFGLNVALGLVLATGAALVLEERFDPAQSLSRVEDLGVTLLFGAPEMYLAWARIDWEPRDGLHSVRRAVSGAAALEGEISAAFEKRYGVSLWQGYGLTEASPAVSTSVGTGRNDPGSVGRPLPGVSVRLVDDGEDALVGDPGEILVKGPNVFPGYWRDERATAEVLTSDGWLRTGDVGVWSEQGDLHIVDRTKDLVIVSGFNVYPGEVERCLLAHPDVAEAAVVGRDDHVTGEAVEAYVVLKAGSDATEAAISEHCVSQLARYKCPSTVVFLDELPRGLAGKALRRALRERGQSERR